MNLDIQIKQSTDTRHAGTVTVELAGSLDTATAPQLEKELEPILAGDARQLVFDLENLRFISSAGLRVLASARKRLRERGGQLSCVNMQPQIQEVFDIVKALPGISIFKDYAEMDAYLAARQRSREETY